MSLIQNREKLSNVNNQSLKKVDCLSLSDTSNLKKLELRNERQND